MTARWRQVSRDELSLDGQSAWDHIAGTRGTVAGPYQALIPVPKLAERVADLGTYLRFQGLLAGTDRELAILVVARELEARYEWVAHEAIARREGTRPEAIGVVAAKGSTETLAPRERLIVDVVRALYRDHRVSDDLFAEARAELGHEQVVELVALVGYYGLIGLVLIGFEVEPAGSASAPF